jgi:hypothetical protein
LRSNGEVRGLLKQLARGGKPLTLPALRGKRSQSHFHLRCEFGNLLRLLSGEGWMGRRLRLLAGGETQHVVQRGNNRMAIFFSDADRLLYLRWLAAAMALQGARLHAYVTLAPFRSPNAPRRCFCSAL